VNAFLAIVGDTWRQSKQQIVFFLMIGVMVLVSVVFAIAPKKVTTKDGAEVLGLFFQDPGEGTTDLADRWDEAYRAALATELGYDKKLEKPAEDLAKSREAYFKAVAAADAAKSSPPAELEPLERTRDGAQKDLEQRLADVKVIQDEYIKEADRLMAERAPGMTPVKKGVELWMSTFAGWLFTLSMLGFIAACSGYYPNMLAAGAVDVLVSKPTGRHVIFFGKYVGGLVLYTGVLLVCYLITFVGVGIRTGVWHGNVFAATTLTLFSVALLYAIVGAIGVLTRSTAFSLVIGYIFYLVVDSVLGIVQSLAKLRLADDFPALKSVGEFARVVFPGFGRLKDAVGASVLHVPIFEGQVLAVASVWLVACLGLAYWRFNSTDF
jgi:ABC-type transport system involved in multi-copper enzyme maturation permease subunit